MNAIQTTHNLDFGVAVWARDEEVMAYRVGTCHGIYRIDESGINIIAIHNSQPHNGHLDDVFEWFEFAARAQGLPLYIRQFFNPRFKEHCIRKRGFQEVNQDDVVKTFL